MWTVADKEILHDLMEDVTENELGEGLDYAVPPLQGDVYDICYEARRHRNRLLRPRSRLRGLNMARKWLRTTSRRWPYEKLLRNSRGMI